MTIDGLDDSAKNGTIVHIVPGLLVWAVKEVEDVGHDDSTAIVELEGEEWHEEAAPPAAANGQG